jgi:MerR family transcriptional regulator/heat shock protein HspR
MRRDDPVYPIGVAARICGCHPQTLRMYEREGLIKPKRVGPKNRMYSNADIDRLKRIQRLTQEMGVNLAGVEIILRLLDDITTMQDEFDAQFLELHQEMERRLDAILRNSNVPVPADEPQMITRFRPRKRTFEL